MRRLVYVLPLALTACQAPPQSLTPVQSAALTPADPQLASLYETSCKACHTVADSGAPLTGDRSQWDARWAKGEDVLLQHAQVGFGAMPAGGQCFTCTTDDTAALIRFMAGRDQ